MKEGIMEKEINSWRMPLKALDGELEGYATFDNKDENWQLNLKESKVLKSKVCRRCNILGRIGGIFKGHLSPNWTFTSLAFLHIGLSVRWEIIK
jgi:hypothetical protein